MIAFVVGTNFPGKRTYVDLIKKKVLCFYAFLVGIKQLNSIYGHLKLIKENREMSQSY